MIRIFLCFGHQIFYEFNEFIMNIQEKPVDLQKLSLRDYVNQLDNSQKTERQKFREALAEVIFCSPVTLRQKIDENRWTLKEKEAIAAYLNSNIEFLFPES